MDLITNVQNAFAKRALFYTLAAASITLTSLFFLNHVEFSLLSNTAPFMHSVFVVVLGLISADVGALLWRRIYLNNCRSAAQVIIAKFMIFTTLFMTTVTTLGGIAEAYSGSAMLPSVIDQWVGWSIIITLSAQFISGAFLFDLFSPENTVSREVTAAMVIDAHETAKQVKGLLQQSRNVRVGTLADQISGNAESAILAALAINTRTLPPATVQHSNLTTHIDIVDENIERAQLRTNDQSHNDPHEVIAENSMETVPVPLL